MIQFEEIKLELLGYSDKLKDLKEALGLDDMRKEIASLEEKTAAENFWGDLDNSQKVLQRISMLKNKIASYENLKAKFDDAIMMIELSDEEGDLDLLPECRINADDVIKELDKQTLGTLLTGEYDSKNAILTFHAGAGGTEAQDWAQMLVRMYMHWSESRGFKCSMVDFLDGDEAGLKSAVLLIEGENAYGYLRSESGVHRLVRVSPFDASGRRHTSFASLEVMPEIDDTIEVNISPDDLKVDTYRASGAGGQKVNKTSSAVRITHIPTGIVTSSQVERSQHQNREVALRMLKSKLIEIKEREKANKRKSAGAARFVPMFSCPTRLSKTIAPALKSATSMPLWTATSTASLMHISKWNRSTSLTVSNNQNFRGVSEVQLIDISRDILHTCVYPGDPEPEVTFLRTIGSESDCNLSSVSACVHTGTHVDAPLHFIEGGAPVDSYPLSCFFGPCTVIEVKSSPITGELVNRKFPFPCERLLIKGGGSVYFMDSAAEEAAALGIKLIGTDALSVGTHGSQIKPHKAFLSKGIPILEGLDLSSVEPGNYFLSAFPMYLGGLEAAPVRAVLVKDCIFRSKETLCAD